MKKYSDMSKEELLTLKAQLDKEFADIKAQGLALDMSRGKPAADQLNLSMELMDVLGDRPLTVCRELTKKYEEAFQTTFSELIEKYSNTDIKGEFVLVIAGKPEEELIEEKRRQWEKISVQEHVEYYVNQGRDKKEAMRLAAKDRGVSKRDIYNECNR